MPEHRRHGRRRPYTAAGVRRLPCFRCGRPASYQWSVCADGNLYRPVCEDCDVALNDLALRFMRDPERVAKIKAYRERRAHA